MKEGKGVKPEAQHMLRQVIPNKRLSLLSGIKLHFESGKAFVGKVCTNR